MKGKIDFKRVKKVDSASLTTGEICRSGGGAFGTNTTFVMFQPATNKKFYLREGAGPITNVQAIIASKFARMISKKHFSSEKWTSDGKTVSLSLPESVIPNPSVFAYKVEHNPDNYSPTEKQKAATMLEKYNNRRYRRRHIKGIGIIDEVCSLIDEHDKNMDNLMFLGDEFDNNTVAIKIDFDGCSPSSSGYDPDKYHHYGSRVYDKCYPRIDVKPYLRYARERALTKLKISLLSDEIIDSLLKMHCPENHRVAIGNIIKTKRDMAIKDLLDSPKYGIKILLPINEKDKDGISREDLENQISAFTEELKNYSQKHFAVKKNTKLSESLDKRKGYINYFINPEVDSSEKLSFVQFHNVKITPLPKELITKCDELLKQYYADIQNNKKDDSYLNKTHMKIEVIEKIRNASSFEKAKNKFEKEGSKLKLQDEREPIKARIIRSIALIFSGGLSYFFSQSRSLGEYFTETRSYSELKNVIDSTSETFEQELKV